ncbi:hypothetical protein SprV_0401658300 [Sparganum proliferum]
MARVMDNGAISEALAVTNRVKKGMCTRARPPQPHVPCHAERDERSGTCIAYRTDGDLVNIRCIQASMHLSWTTVNDLLFKDDFELNITDRNPQHPRHVETATTAIRVGDKRRYKDTLKRLHISPEIWEDLSQDRLARRRAVKTDTVIYKTKRIVTAKPKGQLASSKRLGSITPIANRFQHAPAAKSHSCESTSLDAMQQQPSNPNRCLSDPYPYSNPYGVYYDDCPHYRCSAFPCPAAVGIAISIIPATTSASTTTITTITPFPAKD